MGQSSECPFRSQFPLDNSIARCWERLPQKTYAHDASDRHTHFAHNCMAFTVPLQACSWISLIYSFDKYLLMSYHESGTNCWVLPIRDGKGDACLPECTARGGTAAPKPKNSTAPNPPCPPAQAEGGLAVHSPDGGGAAAPPHTGYRWYCTLLRPQAENGFLVVIVTIGNSWNLVSWTRTAR